MKKIILMLVMTLFCGITAGAQTADGKELTKKERKALQAHIDSMLNQRAQTAIDDSMFVLEADEVVFKRGYTAQVTSNTNFVAVCGTNAVVQVAFNVPWSGFNGLGGITVEGTVSQYEKTVSKKGDTFLRMSVNGRGISAQVFITLIGGCNQASVTVQPNFNSRRITLNGVLLPAEDSQVFKGTTF